MMSPLLLKVAPRSKVKQDMARTSSMDAGKKENRLEILRNITCSNNKRWYALCHTISSLLKVEKAGDNDCRADSGQDKAEHEAPLPGKSQEHSSCYSHWRGMIETWRGLPARDSARQGMKASLNTIADSFRSASGLRPRQARNKITTFGGISVTVGECCFLPGLWNELQHTTQDRPL